MASGHPADNSEEAFLSEEVRGRRGEGISLRRPLENAADAMPETASASTGVFQGTPFGI